MKKQNKKKINNSLPFSYYILLIPVIMGVMTSLIVRGYTFQISEAFFDVSLSESGMATDVFLHGKQIWLYVAVFVALFFLVCFKLLERRIIYAGKWMIFGGLYLILSLISALCAKDMSTAFYGGENLFQGFWTLVSYFVLFYYVYMIFCGEQEKRVEMLILFLRCVLVLSLIMIVIGSLQICGNDPFAWKWVQKICNIEGAQIINNKKIYLTLYNSNYVGVLSVMLVPLLFAGLLIEKIRWIKAGFGIAAVGVIFCTAASGSRTGMFAMVVILVTGSIYFIVKKEHRTGAVIVLVSTILAGCVFCVAGKNTIFKTSDPPNINDKTMTGMEAKNDGFELQIDGKVLKATWDKSGIDFINEKGEKCIFDAVGNKGRTRLLKKLPTAMTTYYGEENFGPQRISDSPFNNIIFLKSGLQWNNNNIEGYVFYINETPYFITNELEKEGYYYFNLYGGWVQPYNSEDVFSKSAYGFASYRGYIWSKTIPKLKSTWLLGTGMDHFVLTFPNHDYVSKAQINKLGVVYNKPHNWYLQIGVESGLISMFSIVIMLIYILAEGVNRGRKYICHPPATNETNIYKTMMLGLGVAVAGYCFMNIFNDQMIVTAPVFWIVLGAYAGISRSLKEDVR